MRIKNMKFIFIIITVILLLFRIVTFMLNRQFDIYLMFLGINQSIINSILYILIIISITVTFYQNLKKFSKYLLLFMASACIVVILFVTSIINSDKDYFYFESPNKSYTLIVEENAFLLSGWSNFYEKKGIFFIKNIKKQITTDDGYKPFSDGNYDVNWINENSVKINYDYGTKYGDAKELIIRFN